MLNLKIFDREGSLQLFHTISIPEIAWTSTSVIGLFLNGRLAFQAWTTVFTLRVLQINSLREYAAVTTMVLFSSLAACQAAFVLIGLNAMTYGSEMRNNALHAPPQQYVSAVIFFFLNIFLVLSAYAIEKRRATLVAKILEIEGGMEK